MRLIDADALLSELQEELEFDSPMCSKEENKYINSGLRIAIKDVKHSPTVDIKTEVAREIFAEIEGIVQGKLKTLSLFKEDEDDFYMGETHALENLLAELKNKYTKEGVE